MVLHCQPTKVYSLCPGSRFPYPEGIAQNKNEVFLVITPGEARSNLTHGVSGKVIKKPGHMFLKVKDHQAAQALDF